MLHHRTIAYVIETSSQMASSVSQKCLAIFWQKSQNCFLPNDFVQISPSWDPNTHQIMYGETLTSNVSVSNGNIKCQNGKFNFCSKFAIKILACYVANADTGS